TTLPWRSDSRTVWPSTSRSVKSAAVAPLVPPPPCVCGPPQPGAAASAAAMTASLVMREIAIEVVTILLERVGPGVGAGRDREDLAGLGVDEHVGRHRVRVEVEAGLEVGIDEQRRRQRERLRP